MPVCSIIQCSARKTKDQLLSLHRFPKNADMRRKWLEAIDIKNLNTRHNQLHVCSLHFDESQFNRTLDVIRLRDNAVPSLCPVAPANISEQVVTGLNKPKKIIDPDVEMPSPSNQVPNFPEVCYIQVYQPNENLTPACEMISRQSEKFQNLQNKCVEQRRHIKRLNEKVRRQGKKISGLQEIIINLKKQMFLNKEQSMLLEHRSGSQGFLKCQIAKTKGLPVEKTTLGGNKNIRPNPAILVAKSI